MHSPFSVHELVNSSVLGNDAITASLLHSNRIYLGTEKGSLLVLDLTNVSTSQAPPSAALALRHDGLTKRPIEQLALLKDMNAIACLAGGDLILHSLPTLSLLTSFSNLTRSTCSLFAQSTHITSPTASNAPPEIHTTFALACRRRLIFLSWIDGTWIGSQELALPHQVRGMAFHHSLSADRLELVAGFSTGEYGIVTLPKTSPNSGDGKASVRSRRAPSGPVSGKIVNDQPMLGELFTTTTVSSTIGGEPSTIATEKPSAGSLSKATGGGLGASLGLGSLSLAGLTTKKIDKNDVVAIPKGKRKEMSPGQDWLWSKEWGWDDVEVEEDAEVIVVRDNIAQILSASSGKSRPNAASIVYSHAVDETVAAPPYVISLLSSSSLAVHTVDTLSPVESIAVPPSSPSTESPTSTTSTRLLTLSSSSPTPPLLLLSTVTPSSSTSSPPNQTLWIITAQTWPEQILSLGEQGLWSTATRLLRLSLPFARPNDAIPPSLLRRLAILRAWDLFKEERFDLAVDAFIKLDLNPAKVIALFPKIVSGKLATDDPGREELFGGRTAENVRNSMAVGEVEANERETEQERLPSAEATKATAQHQSLASRLKEATHIGSSRSPSVDSARHVVDAKKAFNRSVDELVRFLTDRRQQYNKALAALLPSARPSPSQPRPVATASEIFAIPDEGPLSSLKPDQLARVAQVVDTALFKSYLATKPVMVGPLCRIENWCEVEEVEELLLTAKKYRELLDLYNGKSMHQKAVDLLRRMSEDEDDLDEKVEPTVRYLQKLGSAHLSIIFTASEWVFSISPNRGLEIFVADLVEVESLPRHETMHHLDKVGADACIGYLEHIIHQLGEHGAEFHEKLIELYLGRLEPQKEEQDENYKKLLAFLESSASYRADRMLGRLPSTTSSDNSLALVRALLLGRLGRHEGALQIYVYQLSSPSEAEAYCRRISAIDPDIFHVLLRIYLRPRADHPLLFGPALQVISKYAVHLDPIVVFDLLPPLVSIADLNVFLSKTLRRSAEQRRDRLVLKGIAKTWVEDGEREVMKLEERRVKIAEGRVCPVCGKRLGNSVIAIHNPRGEVVHYQCREVFQESRRI